MPLLIPRLGVFNLWCCDEAGLLSHSLCVCACVWTYTNPVDCNIYWWCDNAGNIVFQRQCLESRCPPTFRGPGQMTLVRINTSVIAPGCSIITRYINRQENRLQSKRATKYLLFPSFIQVACFLRMKEVHKPNLQFVLEQQFILVLHVWADAALHSEYLCCVHWQ